MCSIFDEKKKIKKYAQIQRLLCSLDDNTSDENINNVFKYIPEIFFQNKSDLMIICEAFGMYARMTNKSKKGNPIRLFERIMVHMKSLLQDESAFFWNIFGGLYNCILNFGCITKASFLSNTLFKLPNKIQNCQFTTIFCLKSLKNPLNFFKTECKYHLNRSSNKSYIEKFKEIRLKHFRWIRESGDYFDPVYEEIETNPIRLSLKRDDVESFKDLVENNNISLDITIEENFHDNYMKFRNSLSLIEYAIDYNSSKIIKYLPEKKVEMTKSAIFSVIRSNNIEIVEYLESVIPFALAKNGLRGAISLWNDTFVNYIIRKYDNYKSQLLLLLQSAIDFCNFDFLEKYILPLLKNNEDYINENINEIIFISIQDSSCFFLDKMLTHKNIDWYYYSDRENKSFLGKAIYDMNSKAIDIFLNKEEVDVSKPAFKSFPPLTSKYLRLNFQ